MFEYYFYFYNRISRIAISILRTIIMNKRALLFILFTYLLSSFSFFSCNTEKEIKTLIITGGHDYDKAGFDELLAKLPITYDHVEHPNAHAMLAPDKAAPYDVILFYDMPSELTPEVERHFHALGEAGKGIIILHHAFCSYDFWPEYIQIAGGRYQHYPWTKDGIEQPLSTYKHNVTFNIKVEDADHPVTKGVTDFQITDETYGQTNILSSVHPLLSTTEPSSAPLVGWTNTFKNSRVVTLTLGHDRQAWENPSFIQILSQAIKWTIE